jgi:replicative DNA helicase
MYHASNLSLETIERFCKRAENLNLVVVDGLERIQESIAYSTESTNWNVSNEPIDKVINALKELAREKDVPVIGTVNIHRSIERRQNKRPKLKDLKKIGVSEDAADQILFLYRDEYYKEPGAGEQSIAECIVAKNRHGSTGTVKLGWIGQFTKFITQDLEHEEG